MKFVFFGNAPVINAAIRYRVLRFAEMLEAEGHRCIVCLPSSLPLWQRLWLKGNRFTKLAYLFLVLMRRAGQFRHVLGADAVFFRGPAFDYGPPLFERAVRLVNPRLVFDIDDAIWEPPAHVGSPFLRFVDFGWVNKMAAMAAYAVVGNAHLAAHVRPLNQNVAIVPTCIDTAKHRQKTYRHGDEPILLGWTGLKDNLGYMDIIEDVLQDLATRHRIRLLVASSRAYRLEGVEVENREWRLEGEFDYLSEPDIGLMPLKDTPRARGKCAFKALQYMGVGTPAVISPVGMNADVIEDGIDGFLADTPEQWRDKLERLIVDAELRERMGRAARQTVEARYSHDANYAAFKTAMLGAAGKTAS